MKRAQLMSFIYLLSIGVLLVGAGGLFWGYRQKQRSNKQLAKLVQERTQHLQASNEQLNTFIYKSSHDLYGPVKSLQGLVHLLQKSPADNANTANLIGQKVTQLEAELRHLIQTMELKNSALNPSHLSLHTAVHEAVEAVKSTPGGAKVTFSNTIPENAFLTTDPWTLSVILRNLLENAIHFQSSERTSTCDIKVSQAPSAWCIQVTDNGIGVPAAARDKVFDMFFKGSRQSPGSGLGLYNVQLAVEKLDGTVSLEESDEQGASFKVTLPRKG